MPAGLFQSFIPWFVYFILAGSHYVSDETAAIAALVSAIVFTRHGLRKGFILEWGSVLYFTFLSAMYLLPTMDGLSRYAYLSSNLILSLIMWISICIKKPFSMQYAREGVKEIYWNTPTFKQINYAISIVWATALLLMALGTVLQYAAIQIACLVVAIGFTKGFPDWYQGFLFAKLSKKAQEKLPNPYLSGNFAPVKDELSVTHLSIIGKLPEELNGIYMRNGPNPAFPPISYTYPLDGDGMLHALYLSNGNACYRNRFVETKGLLAEKRAGRSLYGGIAHPIPTDPKLTGKDGDPGPVKDGAFIHIVRHAAQYLALWESGPAYEVSAQLETIGEWCPRGGKQPFPVNAHTRLDPATGELYMFTYDFQPPYLSYSVLDREGTLLKTVPIDTPNCSMQHDFLLTENYVIFFDCPAIFNLKALETGDNLLRWQPELGVKIGVIHRRTQAIFWIETAPFFVFHFANAYEQDGKISIDYVRHKKLSLGSDIIENARPLLYRTIIDIANRSATHAQQSDHPVEFPRINDNFNTKQNRYIYLPTKTVDKNGQFNALIKYDAQQQRTFVHDFGKFAEIGEAVFAPGVKTTAEDDGYIMLFVYDRNENQSEFIVLNAQNFHDDPVARIRLPRRVPHGLHGSWMPGPW